MQIQAHGTHVYPPIASLFRCPPYTSASRTDNTTTLVTFAQKTSRLALPQPFLRSTQQPIHLFLNTTHIRI